MWARVLKENCSNFVFLLLDGVYSLRNSLSYNQALLRIETFVTVGLRQDCPLIVSSSPPEWLTSHTYSERAFAIFL